MEADLGDDDLLLLALDFDDDPSLPPAASPAPAAPPPAPAASSAAAPPHASSRSTSGASAARSAPLPTLTAKSLPGLSGVSSSALSSSLTRNGSVPPVSSFSNPGGAPRAPASDRPRTAPLTVPAPRAPVPAVPTHSGDHIEAYSGLKIRNRVMSSNDVFDEVCGRTVFTLATLGSGSHQDFDAGGGGGIAADGSRVPKKCVTWITIGVLSSKSAPKASGGGGSGASSSSSHLQSFGAVGVGSISASLGGVDRGDRGNSMSWSLTDYAREVKVYLNGAAYDAYWKEPEGSIWLVICPTFLPARERGQFLLSVSRPEQLRKVGTSPVFGRCCSKRKDGLPCTMAVDTSASKYCVYHLGDGYRKELAKARSMRPEVSGENVSRFIVPASMSGKPVINPHDALVSGFSIGNVGGTAVMSRAGLSFQSQAAAVALKRGDLGGAPGASICLPKNLSQGSYSASTARDMGAAAAARPASAPPLPASSSSFNTAPSGGAKRKATTAFASTFPGAAGGGSGKGRRHARDPADGPIRMDPFGGSYVPGADDDAGGYGYSDDLPSFPSSTSSAGGLVVPKKAVAAGSTSSKPPTVCAPPISTGGLPLRGGAGARTSSDTSVRASTSSSTSSSKQPVRGDKLHRSGAPDCNDDDDAETEQEAGRHSAAFRIDEGGEFRAQHNSQGRFRSGFNSKAGGGGNFPTALSEADQAAALTSRDRSRLTDALVTSLGGAQAASDKLGFNGSVPSAQLTKGQLCIAQLACGQSRTLGAGATQVVKRCVSEQLESVGVEAGARSNVGRKTGDAASSSSSASNLHGSRTSSTREGDDFLLRTTAHKQQSDQAARSGQWTSALRGSAPQPSPNAAPSSQNANNAPPSSGFEHMSNAAVLTMMSSASAAKMIPRVDDARVPDGDSPYALPFSVPGSRSNAGKGAIKFSKDDDVFGKVFESDEGEGAPEKAASPPTIKTGSSLSSFSSTSSRLNHGPAFAANVDAAAEKRPSVAPSPAPPQGMVDLPSDDELEHVEDDGGDGADDRFSRGKSGGARRSGAATAFQPKSGSRVFPSNAHVVSGKCVPDYRETVVAENLKNTEAWRVIIKNAKLGASQAPAASSSSMPSASKAVQGAMGDARAGGSTAAKASEAPGLPLFPVHLATSSPMSSSFNTGGTSHAKSASRPSAGGLPGGGGSAQAVTGRSAPPSSKGAQAGVALAKRSVDIFSPAVLESLKRTSANAHLVEEDRMKRLLASMDAAERVEKFEEQMRLVTSVERTVWKCVECGKDDFPSKPELCIADGHTITSERRKQGRFECKNCHNRVFAASTRLHVAPCSRCGHALWAPCSIHNISNGVESIRSKDAVLRPTGDAVENSLRSGVGGLVTVGHDV